MNEAELLRRKEVLRAATVAATVAADNAHANRGNAAATENFVDACGKLRVARDAYEAATKEYLEPGKSGAK